jgi:hypothetical protein
MPTRCFWTPLGTLERRIGDKRIEWTITGAQATGVAPPDAGNATGRRDSRFFLESREDIVAERMPVWLYADLAALQMAVENVRITPVGGALPNGDWEPIAVVLERLARLEEIMAGASLSPERLRVRLETPF